jgi:hypothetical protein
MGSAHFLTRGSENVATEMSLNVLAYNMRDSGRHFLVPDVAYGSGTADHFGRKQSIANRHPAGHGRATGAEVQRSLKATSNDR